MRRSVKISFAAICSAISVVLMLLAYFPFFTYSVPAIASLAILVCFLELGGKWAILSYVVSVLPVFLFAENEAKLLYIVFFGYYVVLKAYIEKLSIILAYIAKFILFNAVIIVSYCFLAELIGVALSDFGELGKYGGIVLLVAANFVFLLYDMLIGKIAAVYFIRLHPIIEKMLKRY